MLRKIILLLSLASLAVIAVITISCGNSSSSGSKQCTGLYNVVGNWQVNLTSSGGSDTLYGAIDSAGLALAFDNNSAQHSTGDTIELPTLTGMCSFSGTATAYAEPTGIAQSPLSLTASGNVNSSTSITGSYSGSAAGSFTAAAFTPLSGTITALTGTVTGEAEGAPNGIPVLYPFTFTATGSGIGSSINMSFTTSLATSPNCTVSGTFTQVSTANVYDVAITFAGTSCALTGTFTGLGFESSTDYFSFATGTSATGPFLYADILASTNTFVMEFWVPKP
ncbi:MAG TPA: hypothetical protein VE866_16750 [Candidatus Binatia bacterium]|jgi:hypothetical protein|nr:hypothetical protein [Candidatus Binatia bacterium]